eukprot:g8152.t1
MSTLSTAVLGSDEDDDDYVPEEELVAQRAAAAEKRAAARAATSTEIVFAGRGGGGFGHRGGSGGGVRSARASGGDTDGELVGKAASRKRRADELWAELNAGAVPDAASVASHSRAGAGAGATGAAANPAAGKSLKKGGAKKLKKREALMASLLGGGGGKGGKGGKAASVLRRSSKKRKKGLLEFKVPAAPAPVNKRVKRAVRDGNSDSGSLVKQAKVSVTQTVKYAGEKVSVTKTFTAGTKAANDALRAAAERKAVESAGGIDGALAAIAKPASVSTVTKSSVDWDAFKEENQLTDELEQSTKNGYLQRQDFLQRCDVRQFEQEKAQRSLERAKRDKA